MSLFETVYDHTISYLNVWKFPRPEQLEHALKRATAILIPADHTMLSQFEKHVMFTPNDDTDIEGLHGFFNGLPVITESNRKRTHTVMIIYDLNRIAQDAIKGFA